LAAKGARLKAGKPPASNADSLNTSAGSKLRQADKWPLHVHRLAANTFKCNPAAAPSGAARDPKTGRRRCESIRRPASYLALAAGR